MRLGCLVAFVKLECARLILLSGQVVPPEPVKQVQAQIPVEDIERLGDALLRDMKKRALVAPFNYPHYPFGGEGGGRKRQRLILCKARPWTDNAASCIASYRVGWPWMVRARSSLLAWNSIASTAS